MRFLKGRIKKEYETSGSGFFFFKYTREEVRLCVYLFNKYLLCTHMMPGPVVETREAGRFQNWVIGI